MSAASNAVTATTQAQSGGGSGCTASMHVDSQWNTGFTATVTVANSGTVPTKGWKVTWNWGCGQQITGSWNATVTQSGSAVSAVNLSYNGAVAGGANTTFGVQGTYSGANTLPALTCTAS